MDNSDISSGGDATASYFDTVFQMYAAVSNRDYERAAQLVRENLTYIPGWVEETLSQQDSFNIASIPTLEQGGTVLALVGDDEGLSSMRDLIYSIPHLARWVGKIRGHQNDLELFKAIEKAVQDNPNCLQTEVKNLVGEEDSRHVSDLIAYLEKAGRIIRNREGRASRLLYHFSLMRPYSFRAAPERSA